MKKRVFSGVKPSARLHIGNYIGAIRNWVADLEARENIFCVVDLHAITVDHDPEELRALTRELVGLYIAAASTRKAYLCSVSFPNTRSWLGYLTALRRWAEDA